MGKKHKGGWNKTGSSPGNAGENAHARDSVPYRPTGGHAIRGLIPYKPYEEDMVSIEREMKKLDRIAEAKNLKGYLLEHPPKDADPARWRRFAEATAGHPGLLVLAGTILVPANWHYVQHYMHKLTESPDFLEAVAYQMQTVFFAGFVVEKAMETIMGSVQYLEENPKHLKKCPAVVDFLESDRIKRIVVNYKELAGAFITVNQSLSAAGFMAEAATSDFHKAYFAFARMISALAASGLSTLKTRKVEKHHGPLVDPRCKRIAKFMQCAPMESAVDLSGALYGPMASGILSSTYLAMLCEHVMKHTATFGNAAPAVAAVFAYCGLARYLVGRNTNEPEPTEHGRAAAAGRS